MPVTGLTEAALASAHLLGHRISIIAISQRIQAWYREVVESYGFGSRLASIRALDRPLSSIGGVQEEHAQALQALAERAVDEDGAEVIVLAGAPLAGLARSLQGKAAGAGGRWRVQRRAPCRNAGGTASPAAPSAAASHRRPSSPTGAAARHGAPARPRRLNPIPNRTHPQRHP